MTYIRKNDTEEEYLRRCEEENQQLNFYLSLFKTKTAMERGKIIRKKWNEVSTKQKLRRQYFKLLKNNDSQYHLTITFSKNTSKYSCQDLLNTYLKFLNIKIFKSRYNESLGSSSDESSFVKGFAIREHTESMNTDHFHLLIAEDEYLPNYDRMLEICESQKRRMARNFEGFNKIQKIMLQHAYVGEDGYKLEHYLLKQFNGFMQHDKCEANMGILCNGAVNFNDLDYTNSRFKIG